jgi:hypothetical protein
MKQINPGDTVSVRRGAIVYDSDGREDPCGNPYSLRKVVAVTKKLVAWEENDGSLAWVSPEDAILH